MYTYKGFMDDKKHWTKGEFDGWYTGGLVPPYALFRRRTTMLYLPLYLLTPETLDKLPPAPTVDERQWEKEHLAYYY